MSSPPDIAFADLFRELDHHASRVPLAILIDRIARLQIDWPRITPFIRFGDDTYRRNLMHAGSGYHALVLCWKAGQRSPIHDHRGSSCAVRVLRGVCTETLFQRTADGHIYPTQTHRLEEGHICGSEDTDIHQISNLEPDSRELITLHIYTPPLLTMGKYSLTSPHRDEFVEQVYTFAEGAGI